MKPPTPQQLREAFQAHADKLMTEQTYASGEAKSRLARLLDCIEYGPALQAEPVPAALDITLLETKFVEYHKLVVVLWSNCQAVQLTSDEQFGQQFRQFAELLWYSYCEAYSTLRCALAEQGANLPEVPDHLLSLRYSGFIAYAEDAVKKDKQLNAFQKLLLFLLDTIYRKGWRRFNNDCYAEIQVQGVGTHAWRSVMSIESFVYSATPKEEHRDEWIWITSGATLPKQLIEHLKHTVDAQFPDLRKTRGVLSFSTGVYVCREDRFYPYVPPTPDYAGPLADDLPRSLVSCNFIDRPFVDYQHPPDEWYSGIPTPTLQSIFDYQELSPDPNEMEAICGWVYALIGRLLYGVNEVDQWQVILFIKGTAGSGKSTLCKMISRFYEKCDVGILSNRVEAQFGLSQFVDKLLFIAPEIKRDLQLDQADLQTMVAGEDMAIARKYQDPKTMRWTAPGVLAGNEVPNWTDNSGSVSRRLVVLQFSKKVRKTDTKLEEKLLEELPSIICKCNRAYLLLVETYGQVSLWDDALVPYFKETQRIMQASCNVLVSYLRSDMVQLHAQAYCLEKDFKAGLAAFAKQSNWNAPYRWEHDFYMAIFEDYHLRSADAELPYPIGSTETRHGHYILGCMTLDNQTRRRLQQE